MAYNINDYEPVEVRLDAWWKANPNGRVYTEVLNQSESDITIRAFLFADRNDTYPMATGIANEVKGSSPVNRVSWVENCETSALGRALANANYAAKGKRASREEMEKVQRGPIPEAQTQLREKLAAKFPEMADRKKWIEETVGREVAGLNELTEGDIQVLMALL